MNYATYQQFEREEEAIERALADGEISHDEYKREMADLYAEAREIERDQGEYDEW